jgi:hypothetical protein
MNIYVKSVAESQFDAMDLLRAELGKVSISSPSSDGKHFVN